MAAVQINSVYTGIAGSHISGRTSRASWRSRNRKSRAMTSVVPWRAQNWRSFPMSGAFCMCCPREFMVDDQEGVREPLGMSGNRLEVNVHVITGR